jgi:hypothetical protein
MRIAGCRVWVMNQEEWKRKNMERKEEVNDN